MNISRTLIILLVSVSLCVVPSRAVAESVGENFSEITPDQQLGQGEFIHGRGYGKILIRVLMFGSIPRQGIHYVPEGTDLLFAILYAGGYGEMSSLNGITIRRRDVRELLEVDLEDLIEEGQRVPTLRDGDIVNVPYNWKKSYRELNFITQVFVSLTSLILSVVALTR